VRNEPRRLIARSLEILGQKWSLLIVREAFFGRTRFSEFRERLGVAPDVLTDRLARLVDAGILERRSYREDGARERHEYVLTEAGRCLRPVLASLAEWGDEHRPTGYGPAVRYVETATGNPVHVAFLSSDGRPIPDDEVSAVRGPGAV
jgi:DNA-binding HxlR family transcriptional regulator